MYSNKKYPHKADNAPAIQFRMTDSILTFPSTARKFPQEYSGRFNNGIVWHTPTPKRNSWNLLSGLMA